MTEESFGSALELFPRPAALFEWAAPQRFIIANEAARRAARDAQDAEVQEAIGPIQVLEHAASMREAGIGEPNTIATRLGVVVVGRIAASPAHPRPDLLLITLHAELADQEAIVDHKRMASVLDVNETLEVASDALATIQTQLLAIAAMQVDIRTKLFEVAADYFTPPMKLSLVRGIDNADQSSV